MVKGHLTCDDICIVSFHTSDYSCGVCSDHSSLEAASATANDVTATIMAQRLELDSKTKTVEMLQKALHQQRELTVYHAKEIEKEGQKRLELQKTEYEATIQRHQCFIDQVCQFIMSRSYETWV